jgi:uncharacterized BrkB/YihY/UPF0761 family membrane protein
MFRLEDGRVDHIGWGAALPPQPDEGLVEGHQGGRLLLILVSVVLMLVVTIGGALGEAGGSQAAPDRLHRRLPRPGLLHRALGARGLALVAALAILLGIFAAIAGPGWIARDKPGFESPALDEPILGLVTFLIVPVQLLLIAFAMRGFQQAWNVEDEVPESRQERYGSPRPGVRAA